MPITLQDTSISGLGAGGLPENSVTRTTLATTARPAVVGYAYTMLRGRYSYSMGASWTTLSEYNVTYTAKDSNNLIHATFYIGALGAWSAGNTQGFRFLKAGSAPLTGDASGDVSEKGHSTNSWNWSSDGNHGITTTISAWLGTAGNTSAQTYSIQFGCESGNTITFGGTQNNHPGSFVGIPSPCYLLIQEYSV